MKRAFSVFILSLFGLVSCVDRSIVDLSPEALEVGTAKTVFAATSRERNSDGSYGFGRSDDLDLLEFTVSIPPRHKPGHLNYGYGEPNAERQFVIADRKVFKDGPSFRRRVGQVVHQTRTEQQEATVYVHGFNTTQAESAFRAAQLAHDIDLPGAQVVYSWPSRGSPLAYAYDGDSVLFARDGLETLLRGIKRSGAKRIVIVAHSMGSVLTMETLRQIEIRDPGWTKRSLSGVVLISPDLDVDVFRAQMQRIPNPPEPFIVFVSREDKILNLSQRIRGTHSRERLGNIKTLDGISGLPIEIIDTTEFSEDAASSHFVAGSSPTLLKMLGEIQVMAEAMGHDQVVVDSLFPGLARQYRGTSQDGPIHPFDEGR